MESYKIKKGDTLGAIAKRYNVSVSDLAIANNISNPNKIREGLTLSIPEATKKFSQKELVKVYKTEKPVYDTKKLYQGLDTEKVDNEKVVRDYMKGREEFILIDKKTNTLRKFDKQGNEVISFRVGLGKDKGDKYTINSKNEKIDRDVTGAGIYITDKKSDKESYAHDYENNILLLKNESGLRQAMSIHQIPNSLKEKRTSLLADDNLTNDDFSNGCVNCTKEQFEKYLKVVQPGQKVIVLPEEEGNYFTVKGKKLSFTTNKDKEFGQYNYTPKTKEVTPFNLKPKESSEYKEKFIDALTKEKANLIKDLKISNEDYDELAKRAYGIFGQESSFGEGSWNPAHNYRAEQLFTLSYDTPEQRKNRSLGLTQIRLKHVDTDFAKKYKIDENTLYYPYQAALATMERLADSYQAVKNPKIREKYKEMTPENSYDYALTFYNKPETVRQGKASGNNQYVRQVKQFYSELEPEQNVAGFQRGGITKLGYRKDSPYKDEPYLVIESNNISMDNVDKDLILLPNKGKPVLAKANSGGYLFPNASQVKEIPLYQAGGVSMKPVSPFMDLKMFKNRYKMPQLPTYQDGGILDNYIKTLPEEQQNVFMGEFQSLEPDVQKEVIFMLGGKYQMGGTAEVEGEETAVLPDSELVKFKGKKHDQGGIKVDLPNGTRIYSEHTKAPSEIVEQVLGKKVKGKMSYADLSKKFPTKNYMEILDNPDSDQYQKNSAQIK
nr:LysM peptidoglycan-binding domain-containing protein [Candidatus Paceibacterota bacterium]